MILIVRWWVYTTSKVVENRPRIKVLLGADGVNGGICLLFQLLCRFMVSLLPYLGTKIGIRPFIIGFQN